MSSEWAEDQLDLATYLDLLELAPGRVSMPNLATLRRVQRAHQTAIPFANTDILLGRGIDLSLPAIHDKLVLARRGGYCHEHNLLFAAALTRLGYRVMRLAGRVRVGDATALRPRTHMTLLVTSDGADYITDVGFGADAPSEPVPLRAPLSTADGWTYRVRPGPPDGWLLQVRDGASWSDLYSFGRKPEHLVDYVVATHYTSTHPRSPFVRGLHVSIARPTMRFVLAGRHLEELRADGSRPRGDLDDAAFAARLRDVFKLHLPNADLADLTQLTARESKT